MKKLIITTLLIAGSLISGVSASATTIPPELKIPHKIPYDSNSENKFSDGSTQKHKVDLLEDEDNTNNVNDTNDKASDKKSDKKDEDIVKKYTDMTDVHAIKTKLDGETVYFLTNDSDWVSFITEAQAKEMNVQDGKDYVAYYTKSNDIVFAMVPMLTKVWENTDNFTDEYVAENVEFFTGHYSDFELELGYDSKLQTI